MTISKDGFQTEHISTQDLEAIAQLLKAEAGIHIDADAKALVVSRLARRLRHAGCTDFAEYVSLVRSTGGRAERAAMIAALTTNTTRFFREPAHFTLLSENLIPQLRERARHGGRVRLWSAGCSTGEEPYSIAATLLATFPDAAQYDVRILATDINQDVLMTAQAGAYPSSRAETLSPDQIQCLFEPGQTGQLQIRKALHDLVHFRPLNLIADWPMRGPFDAIFCRNVAIYMDPPTQSRLWTRLEQLLHPDGLLFIGHSERLGPQLSSRLTSCGTTAFCRGRNTGQVMKETGQWP